MIQNIEVIWLTDSRKIRRV